jgi:hypothetical protein
VCVPFLVVRRDLSLTPKVDGAIRQHGMLYLSTACLHLNMMSCHYTFDPAVCGVEPILKWGFRLFFFVPDAMFLFLMFSLASCIIVLVVVTWNVFI